MEVKIVGTLVAKHDFRAFDEILTVLAADGRVLSCMSIGSRRIESKNARQLTVGNRGVFEIFEARAVEKMSRLKKFVATDLIGHAEAMSHSLNFVFDCISARAFEQNANAFLNDVKKLVLRIGDDRAVVYAILAAMQMMGRPFLVDRCIVCNASDVFALSFGAGGMKCRDHYSLKLDGKVGEETSRLIVQVVKLGPSPLGFFTGPLAPSIRGAIAFFEAHSGMRSPSLHSLKRKYARVILDQ